MESLLHNSLAIRVFFAAIAATPSIKVTLSTIFVIIAAVSTGMHNGSTVYLCPLAAGLLREQEQELILVNLQLLVSADGRCLMRLIWMEIAYTAISLA